MPIRPRFITCPDGRTAMRAAAVAGAMLTLAPAVASAADCAAKPTTKAFAAYGDSADYSLAPGGNFESGPGWALTGGAKIVSGNSTVKISGPGTRALSLPMGSTATSPEFCVSNDHPYFRYMLKNGFLVSAFTTIIEYKDVNGNTTGTTLGGWLSAPSWLQPNLGTGAWKPGAKNPLSLTIPLSSTGTATARIKFFVGAGSYQVDDVMIDPYRRG